MQCPACQGLLASIKMHSASLDWCQDGCGGLWFNHGELEAVLDKMQPGSPRTPAYQTGRITDRPCPECQQALEARHYDLYSDVEIDVCSACQGLWLDRGELEKLAAVAASKADSDSDSGHDQNKAETLGDKFKTLIAAVPDHRHAAHKNAHGYRKRDLATDVAEEVYDFMQPDSLWDDIFWSFARLFRR